MKAILIDTNLLLLFLVGNLDPTKVSTHRRLQSFDLDDLEILNDIVTPFPKHVSLPNVITETSNFIGSGKQEITNGAALLLAKYCQTVDEIYQDSRLVVTSSFYLRFGLTDAAIIAASKQDVTVVTDDYALHGCLHKVGVKAINIRHFKTPR